MKLKSSFMIMGAMTLVLLALTANAEPKQIGVVKSSRGVHYSEKNEGKPVYAESKQSSKGDKGDSKPSKQRDSRPRCSRAAQDCIGR